MRPSMSENLNIGGVTGVCGSLPIQNKHPGGQVFIVKFAMLVRNPRPNCIALSI